MILNIINQCKCIANKVLIFLLIFSITLSYCSTAIADRNSNSKRTQMGSSVQTVQEAPTSGNPESEPTNSNPEAGSGLESARRTRPKRVFETPAYGNRPFLSPIPSVRIEKNEILLSPFLPYQGPLGTQKKILSEKTIQNIIEKAEGPDSVRKLVAIETEEVSAIINSLPYIYLFSENQSPGIGKITAFSVKSNQPIENTLIIEYTCRIVPEKLEEEGGKI